MSLLEERYRRVLRLLPASYRAEREEEMVAAFLEGADRKAGPDEQWPRAREVASVAALAFRLWLGGPGAPPTAVAWGAAVRRAAVLGLVFWTAAGVLFATQAMLTYGPGGAVLGIGDPGVPERTRHVLAELSPLLWAGSLAALVLGRPRTAKAAAVAALVVPWALVPPDLDTGSALRWAGTVLPAAATVLALAAGFHRDAPPARLPGRTAVRVVAIPAAAGVVLALGVGVLGALTRAGTVPASLLMPAWMWFDLPGLACAALLAVTMWCLARRAGGRPHAAVALGAAMLTVPAVLARAVTLDTGDPTVRSQLAVLVVSGLVLAVLGARELRTAGEARQAG